MKLKIGENIKRLRRERELTQEELAEILGVTFQSVSRWENDSCYPDVELIPTIAGFFGVSVDVLMGTGDARRQAAIDAYLARFQEAVSRGAVDECIAIAREGLAEYPDSFALMNKLMYALFLAGDDDGNIPDWKENMEKYDREITALGERIMKYCPDQEIRLEAMDRLAFNHCEMGRKAMGRAVYQQLPPLRSCWEMHMWWALEEEEKLPFARELVSAGYDALNTAMYYMIDGDLLPDCERIEVFRKMRALREIVFDGSGDADMGRLHGAAHELCCMAAAYARLNQREEAMRALEEAVVKAKAFDARPESGTYGSLLLGDKQWKRTDFETDDSRPCARIMGEKWLAREEFDALRKDERFQKVLRALE